MAQTDLEETGTGFRRQIPTEDTSGMRVDGNRVNLPQWLFIYLIAQLIGSIWWAATLQSDVRYLQQDNAKAWQKIETHGLQLDHMDETVRKAVREAMEDSGYVRIDRNRKSE